MKVLVVSHPCVTSINQQFYAEVEQQTGWALTLVVPSNWKSEYGGDRIVPGRWPTYKGTLVTLPTWLSGNIPLHGYRSWLVGLLRREQPDVIYVNHEPYGVATAQVYLANLLSGRKPIGFFTWQNIFKTYPFPFSQLQSFVFGQSNFAFPGSQSAMSVLRQKGYQGPCTILPGTIDPQIYAPDPAAVDLADGWRQQSDEVVIGYLGRIVEEKGFATLAIALSQIKALPWRLVLVGAGDYLDTFKAQMAEAGLADRVTYVGYVPHEQAPLYLSAFDLLVIPSETRANWKEQFGRVIIEAMACLTPVVGSDSGEIPHLIRRTGGGQVFAEGQPVALAKRLSEMITSEPLRRSLAETGQQTVKEKYTTAAVVRQFVETIR